MIGHAVFGLYRLWHGKLHLKGAGALLTKAAASLPSLQHYSLTLPEGTRIQVDFRDVSAMYWCNHLMGDPFEEHGLVQAIHQHMESGDILWDIGANSGLLSYHIAKAGKAGEIHSFEPNPKMSRLASQAVSSFQHAVVHPFGISETDAELTLTIPHGHTTMGTLEPDSTGRSGDHCTVVCRAGDDLVFKEGFRPPRIIKIDTEGHELSVLRGLRRTIATHRPVIFLEHISLDLDEVKEVVPSSYRQFTVCDSTGELHPADAIHLGHNSALLPVG